MSAAAKGDTLAYLSTASGIGDDFGMAEPSVSLEVAGQTIAGRYVVEEVLGQGGMAAVYRVFDSRLDRRCALKRSWSRSEAGEQKRRALLEREYYTLAQLAHPRIIAVYDFGVDERGPYYTMELLEGDELDGIGRVPWRRACALLRDIASSLAILHSRGFLHRDLSAHNVRCDAEGRAKLIDFGALCSIGVSREVIGTPPFVAPEVMQMQTLDSRADLYSLGALGYQLLTGRHAYPARRLHELRDIWRSTPTPLERLTPDLPAALCALVMQLLALDRNTRPQSAAEIMKRLCAIADLPVDEDIAVSRAYLASPTMIGRDAALVAIRRQMLALARGDGGTLLIEGVAGSGRSRMLDACGLEGKLAGALVVRAGGLGAPGADWAVARQLCSQLAEHLPAETEQVGNLSRDVLGHFIPSLRPPAPTPGPERSLLIRELREFVLGLCGYARLILLVDDVDRIDEPSLAWLTSLAHKTDRRPLLLVLATDKESQSSRQTSLRLLRSLANVVELDHLDSTQTEALMRSVFGDVPNLPLLAARVQTLSHGNARATMELVQHVVQRGLARYEAGAWSLPPQLPERELPNTLNASLEARLAALSPDARELSDVFCVAETYAISSTHLSELTQNWAHDRLFKALHELVTTRVLVVEAEHYHFSHHGFSSVVRALMPEPRRRAVHGALADSLATVSKNELRRAHHLLEAGRDLEAIQILVGIDLRTRHANTSLLRRALERAQLHRLSIRTISDLRLGHAIAALYALDSVGFRQAADPLRDQLSKDSGLTRYRQLHTLSAAERLRQALVETQRSHLELPEHERGYSVIEAIPRLARLTNGYAVIALWSIDHALIDSLPSLAPLSDLSPTIGVTMSLLEASAHWISGRFQQATDLYERALARLEQPDGAGLDQPQLQQLRMNCHVLLGMTRSSGGMLSAELSAHALEQDPAFRANTWRIRQIFCFSQGDIEEAQRCARRAALLLLQDGLEQQAATGIQAIEVLTHARGENLIALGHALEALTELLPSVPNLKPVLCFGQAAARMLQGEHEAALSDLQLGLELAPPGRHWAFVPLAAAQLRVLNRLGHWNEAVMRGRAYVEIAAREGLTDSRGLRVDLALALASSGQPEEALATIAPVIAEYLRRGLSGIELGYAYEAAARIASKLNDRDRFNDFAEACGREYLKGTSPVLRAKLARLIAEANPDESAERESELLRELEIEAPLPSRYDGAYGRLRECVDARDRARCALTLILQQTDRFAGALCRIDGQDLHLMAALPDAPDAGLDAWLREWLSQECAQDGLATITTEQPLGAYADAIAAEDVSQSQSKRAGRYLAADGGRFEAIALAVEEPRGRRVVALVALQLNSGPRTVPNKALLEEIASLMLEHGDATGVLSHEFRSGRSSGSG